MNSETQTPNTRPVRRRRRLYETRNAAMDSSTNPPEEIELTQKKPTFEATIATSTPAPEAVEPAGIIEPSPSSQTEVQADPAPRAAEAPEHQLTTGSPRLQEAENIVRDHVWWSMTLGLIPVPWLDVVAVSGVQLKMIHRLCDYYQQPFSEQQARAIIAALIGGSNAGFIGMGVTRTLSKFMPLVGFVSMPIAAGALTYAVGRVFVQHFELGGTLLSFEVEKMRKHFAQEQAQGRRLVS